MTTVAQAAELWCPLVRIARRESERPPDRDSNLGEGDTFVVAGCNTDALGKNRVPASCRCIADKCAMWRWIPSTSDAIGYCGIAGRPETSF